MTADIRTGVIVLIRIAICDDEIGTCADVENLIISYAKSHALQIETEVFYSGETLYASIQGECSFDLIFLDIELFELNGIQVGKQIREQLRNENICIVYISSKEVYAMNLFQVRPLDFLIKPITEEKIRITLEKFIRLSETLKTAFYFNIGKSIHKLRLDEIRYFACNGKKIEIYTGTGKTEFYGAMQEVLEQISGKGFWTIHKSYVVNAAYVSVYHHDSVELTDGTVLPISQKYRKAMKSSLAELYRKG